ncbi:MAG: GTP-binding protein, partial [Burkholderiales bacterium]
AALDLAIVEVPTTIIVGGTAAERGAAIERLRLERAATEPATVFGAPAGCLCCVGLVTFRVALTRLLREERPGRLIIELDGSDHADRTLAMLRGEWFSKALRIERVERLTSSPG